MQRKTLLLAALGIGAYWAFTHARAHAATSTPAGPGPLGGVTTFAGAVGGVLSDLGATAGKLLSVFGPAPVAIQTGASYGGVAGTATAGVTGEAVLPPMGT